jgi:hypothetical protein
VFLSILESSRHELRIAHGLSLMTPSLRGWEAFPTPGALTHTRITWAFSPPAPQVPGVTPGSPLCPWCFGHPFGEVRDRAPSRARLIDWSELHKPSPKTTPWSPSAWLHYNETLLDPHSPSTKFFKYWSRLHSHALVSLAFGNGRPC